jgi:hypothetical protein
MELKQSPINAWLCNVQGNENGSVCKGCFSDCEKNRSQGLERVSVDDDIKLD